MFVHAFARIASAGGGGYGTIAAHEMNRIASTITNLKMYSALVILNVGTVGAVDVFRTCNPTCTCLHSLEQYEFQMASGTLGTPNI